MASILSSETLDHPVVGNNSVSSIDSDEIDETVNMMRRSKVWNEPNYKTKNIPEPLTLQNDWDNEDMNDRKPLNIEVNKGTNFFSDPIRMYTMSSSQRGRVLIINNQEFENPSLYTYREGADVDAKNLELLFTQLGFTVTNLKNMRRNEMLKKLIDFSDVSVDKAGDMMVVCILSHGLEHGKIVAVDGVVLDTEQDVLRYFHRNFAKLSSRLIMSYYLMAIQSKLNGK